MKRKNLRKSCWQLDFDLDFSTQATLDLDDEAASITLFGQTWAQFGPTYADDLDLVNASGLVVNMSAANSTFDTTAATMWHITLPLSNTILFGTDYDPDKMIAVQVMLSGIGDAATEIHGVLLGNALGATDIAGAAGIGSGGTLKYRQQGAVVSTSSASGASADDCIMLVKRSGSWTAYYGTSLNGQWPTSWTQAGGDFASNTAANNSSAFVAATDLLGLWAATGNTSNNFSPVFRKIRGYITSEEVPS